MPIVGFNFTKIDVEKKELIKGKINISNNISVKDIKEKDMALGQIKQKGISFEFEFSAKYEPNTGHINLLGNILYLDKSETVDSILKEWKKDKKIPKEIMAKILNTALTRCNIQALILSQDINLPPPIPLPKVKTEQK